LRVPFIDRPLVEWLWRQPSRFKFDRRRPKSVLVEATADLLPPGLIKRRKRGFTLPFPVWMRTTLRPFIEDTFSPASIGQSGLFSHGPIQKLWTDFVERDENSDWSRVWSLAVLIAFVNRRKVPQCR
jgi:asparagine synthase (glutamine-hydrolysing)